MTRHVGRHRKPSTVRTTALRTAAAGIVIAAPTLALTGTANAASDATWDRVAQCESGGDWSINTGNGYEGGLQFSPSTWRAYGGEQYAAHAYNASREQQIAIAERVLQGQGWGAWTCAGMVGASGGVDLRDVSSPAPKAAAPKGAAIGQITSVHTGYTSVHVLGWAEDASNTSSHNKVQLLVDGKVAWTGHPANATATHGSHGFNVNLTNLKPGKHTVSLTSYGAVTKKNLSPKSFSVTGYPVVKLLKLPSSVKAGSHITVTGQLTVGGKPVVNNAVDIFAIQHGSLTWHRATIVRTGKDGMFRATIKVPAGKMTYEARWGAPGISLDSNNVSITGTK